METHARFFAPTRPYGIVDAINRAAAATGSPGYARAASGANYNGHSVSVHWNDYRGYWLAEYYYGERVVLARGEFESCLRAAMAEYNRGALGSSVHVETRTLEHAVLCANTHGLMVWSKEAEESEYAKWFDWKHKEVGYAIRRRTEHALIEATDRADYERRIRLDKVMLPRR